MVEEGTGIGVRRQSGPRGWGQETDKSGQRREGVDKSKDSGLRHPMKEAGLGPEDQN